jgi:hypothetical protein
MDHDAIRKIAVHHQVVLSSSNTGVKSKLFFEKATYDDAIVIQRCHTDNGAFTLKQFFQAFMESQQTKRFSLSDMLDTVMFLVEEEKADESQIPTLNKDRLLMSFASVDHLNSMYHHCMHYHATTLVMRLPVNGTMTRLTGTGRITRWQ